MSCLLDNARIGLYLPTVILRPTIISYSITHSLSFQAYNLPFLQILPTAALNSLSSSEIFSTWIPRTVYCYFGAYLFSTFSFFLFLHFLVVGSVR